MCVLVRGNVKLCETGTLPELHGASIFLRDGIDAVKTRLRASINMRIS